MGTLLGSNHLEAKVRTRKVRSETGLPQNASVTLPRLRSETNFKMTLERKRNKEHEKQKKKQTNHYGAAQLHKAFFSDVVSVKALLWTTTLCIG